MIKIILGEFKNYIYIFLGSFCLALSLLAFLLPNSITTGGTPGMALLLSQVSSLSIASLMILFNIPLVLLGIKFLGKAFAIRTISTIVIISIIVDLLQNVFEIKALVHETLLASVFGGILIGLGIALILKGKSSAGGTTVLASLIASKTEFKQGQVLLFFDAIIIVLSIFIFKDLEKALWSIISIYATAKIVDLLLSGTPSKKVIHLVTSQVSKISQEIEKKLGEEGTIIKGTALDIKSNKTIIFLVVDLNKLQILRNIIQECDKDAFMLIMEASEMLGREK